MSIGNCPRCGAQTDDENDLCYQCALRRIAIEMSSITFPHQEYEIFLDETNQEIPVEELRNERK